MGDMAISGDLGREIDRSKILHCSKMEQGPVFHFKNVVTATTEPIELIILPNI